MNYSTNTSFGMSLLQEGGAAKPSLVQDIYKDIIENYNSEVQISIAGLIIKALHPHAKINPKIDTSDNYLKKYVEDEHILLLKHIAESYTHDTRTCKKSGYQNALHFVHRETVSLRNKFDATILNNKLN